MTLTVIGVVADTRSFGPDSPEPPVVYAPYTLSVWTSMFLVVEAQPNRDAAALLDGVRAAVHGVDPDIPAAGPGFTNRVRPMEDYAANLLQTRRLNTALLGGFAVFTVIRNAFGG